MAKTRQRAPQAPNGFVASAVSLPVGNRFEVGSKQGWQQQAWNYYDTVGELRYLANWIGNVLSRAELHAAKREGNQLVPVTEGPAFEAMEALYGGPQGQAEMLSLVGESLTVGGECYLTAREKDDADEWNILTSGKVTQQGKGKTGKVMLNFGDGEKSYEKQPEDLVVRIWTPHPTNPKQADAPTRSNLRTLSQITGYDEHISAQISSRLAGAGVLILPSEIEFAAPEGADPEATQADNFLSVLGEAMMTPIQDRSSPAAIVPIVVTAPGEFIDKVQYLTFWGELDDAVIEMRQAAIKRFGIGMDVPPEVLLGNADANHWNAWLSEESAIKAHLEPRLTVVTSALSTGYLRPSLTDTGVEPTEYYVIADTTPIRLRPNRATEALELNDRGVLSNEATMRETGFKPEDAMQGEEFVNWLLKRIATGAVDPATTAEALRILGAPIQPIQVSTEPQEPPDHVRTDTNPEDSAPSIPDRPDLEPLAASCEVLVYRALERAGNRLRNLHPRTDTKAMPAADVYFTLSGDADHLLAGAWECAEKVLADYDVPVDEVTDMLDFYVRGLLARKRPISRATITSLLASVREPVPA